LVGSARCRATGYRRFSKASDRIPAGRVASGKIAVLNQILGLATGGCHHCDHKRICQGNTCRLHFKVSVFLGSLGSSRSIAQPYEQKRRRQTSLRLEDSEIAAKTYSTEACDFGWPWLSSVKV